LGQARLPIITAYSKLSPNEAGNDENLLKTKIVNLTIRRGINRLHIAKLLKGYIDYMMGLIYNYANEITIEIKGSLFLLNDIRHNRINLCKWYVNHFGKISYVNKNRHYNVIAWNIHGESNINVCVLFVILELAVTKSIRVSG